MRYLEAPNNFPPTFVSVPEPSTVYLGGGIARCPNWQDRARIFFSQSFDDSVLLVNPRRPKFDLREPTSVVEQISWELRWLEKADYAVFWFPAEAVSPTQWMQPLHFLLTKGEIRCCIGVQSSHRFMRDVVAYFNIAARVPIIYTDLDVLLMYAVEAIGAYNDVRLAPGV